MLPFTTMSSEFIQFYCRFGSHNCEKVLRLAFKLRRHKHTVIEAKQQNDQHFAMEFILLISIANDCSLHQAQVYCVCVCWCQNTIFLRRLCLQLVTIRLANVWNQMRKFWSSMKKFVWRTRPALNYKWIKAIIQYRPVHFLFKSIFRQNKTKKKQIVVHAAIEFVFWKCARHNRSRCIYNCCASIKMTRKLMYWVLSVMTSEIVKCIQFNVLD